MLFQFLSLLLVTAVVLYLRKDLITSVIVIGTVLFIITLFSSFHFLPWVLLALVAIPLMLPEFRREKIARPLFLLFRKVLPKMNTTEKEALEAGDVWWDGDLFQGNPDWDKWLGYGSPKLSEEEQSFVDNQVETLCGMLDDWTVVHIEKDLPEKVWQYIKKEKFLGMIIPKSYGGLEFSALAHSTVVTKLATHCGSAAVDVMVPNSLGPAELLLHYGTDEQKNHYLPKLAVGKEIPCFALTAPDAGSDASAMTDTGVICKGKYNGQQVTGIRLNWNKRYITLAPVATVLGLAFKLEDPEGFLGDTKDLGITVALIPTHHKGVVIGQRHLPMNAAFMNGPTQGKDVFIPLDWIVGGADFAGKGWMMLMECLSAGRAISLPGMGAASGIMSYRMTGAYARVRHQFNTSIYNFAGVEEAMAQIAGQAYMLEASRVITASAVDLGLKPSVISAIAKYHMTEAGRSCINHAMDVHGGRGVILGERNYLAHGYMATPIGITVEGANILTRNLMIFGQGAIRCHPYVFNEMEAAHNTDEVQGLKDFDANIFSHLAYALSNFVRSVSLGLSNSLWVRKPVRNEMGRYYQHLTRMSSVLAFISGIAMGVLGGDLKRKERLSARLGDILSQLYLASTVLRYFENGGCQQDEKVYVHWNVQRSLYLIQEALVGFCRNFPNRIVALLVKACVLPLGKQFKMPDDKLDHQLVSTMVTKSQVRDRITEVCFIGQGVNDRVGRVELAFEKVLIAADAERELRRLLKSSELAEADTLELTLKQAVAQKLLTSEQSQQILDSRAARWEAIQVDDYSPAEVVHPDQPRPGRSKKSTSATRKTQSTATRSKSRTEQAKTRTATAKTKPAATKTKSAASKTNSAASKTKSTATKTRIVRKKSP